MKILIDPMMAVLVDTLSPNDCREVLRCIYHYPELNSDIPLWIYIKKQIDADAKKYLEKCESAARAREKRKLLNGEQSFDFNMESELKSELKSTLESELKPAVNKCNVSVIKDNVIKSNVSVCTNSEPVSIGQVMQDMILGDGRYEITWDFSLAEVIRRDVRLAPYFSKYPIEVIERANKSLIAKRRNQKLTMKQILNWIESEF